MKDMADAIVKCARLVQEGLPLLRVDQRRGRPPQRPSPSRFRRWRATPTICTTQGMQELYQANAAGGNTALDFFVGNEVYDHLEKVVDRFDDVANVMHGIVIEHV